MKDGQTTFNLFENEDEQTLSLDTDKIMTDIDEEFLSSINDINIEETRIIQNINYENKSLEELLPEDINITEDESQMQEIKKFMNSKTDDINLDEFTKTGNDIVLDSAAITNTVLNKINQEATDSKSKENHDNELTNVIDKLTNESNYGKANIMVIGVGGCGVNAIGRMEVEGFEKIKLVAIDTSQQSLESIKADRKLLVGQEVFSGHGSGNDTVKTLECFKEAQNDIQKILIGVDMVFITGGIGRGTGSVGLIEVGRIAKELGVLTIGVATLPKAIEVNYDFVEEYYSQFIESVDSNIIIDNDKVNAYAKDMPIAKAMKVADQMLVDGIRGISDLIANPGKINLDYADIKTAFSNQGSCVMGIGYGKGDNAVVKAIENSINSDIIEEGSIEAAKTVIFNITCARNSVTIEQAAQGTDLIYSKSASNDLKHMLFGYSYDDTLDDEVKVTFIATGTAPIDFSTYNKKPNPKTSLFGEEVKKNKNVDIFGDEISTKPDFFN